MTGLRHFGYQKEAKFYNGVTLDHIHGTNGVEKSNVNGIGEWSKAGIVGRGILLDYHEWRIKQGRDHHAFETGSITAEDLRAVAKEQGTEIKFGDIMLIRSGYMDAYSKLSREEIEAKRTKQPLTFTGVEQSEDMSASCLGNSFHISVDRWCSGIPLVEFRSSRSRPSQLRSLADTERLVATRGDAWRLGHADR